MVSMAIPKWGDGRQQRIGLLGGSFNPAHEGHQAIARQGLKLFNLDRVWLMVSPGNPLKDNQEMAPYLERRKSAMCICDGHRIVVSDIEKYWGVRHTAKTVTLLKCLFPNIDFLWLMGADGLCTLPKWYRWRSILWSVPMGIFPRPGYNREALHGQALSFIRSYRVSPQRMRCFPYLSLPAWSFPLVQQSPLCATNLRRQRTSKAYL